MANNPLGHIGLFDKRGTGYKIHKSDCGMLRTAGRRHVPVAADDNEIDDLLERKYKVTFCKCVPKSQRRPLVVGETYPEG